MESIKNSNSQDYITYIASKRERGTLDLGFTKLNSLLCNNLPSGITTIGAMPSLGKTTFCLQLARTISQQDNTKVLFFNLEMSNFDLITKNLSAMSFENDEELTYSEIINDIDLNKLAELSTNYEEKYSNLLFVDTLYKIDEIVDCIHNFIKENPNDKVYVFVDYLQYIQTDISTTTKQGIDYIIQRLKNIGKLCNIPIVLISSMNRNSYENENDMTSFKESGNIEYTSDVLISLEYTETNVNHHTNMTRDKRSITLKILKNRNGSIGKINFEFYAKYNTFLQKN